MSKTSSTFPLTVCFDGLKDGVYERLENFLLRRGETLVSIDVKDKKTGNTALIWAAKRGHAKVRWLVW